MKNFKFLMDKLKDYNLDSEDYAVFGSAPLVITGMIDDVNDLDVIIRPSKWEFNDEGEYRTKYIEFFNNWPEYDIDDLIDNHSFVYNGVRFINPKKVIEYKKSLKRNKDKNIWDN
jgi:hypothetical protein